MKVIAYTYEADYHCLDCATKRFGHGEQAGKLAVASLPIAAVEFDENWIPYNQEDNEGNPIHPVFSTDDLENASCGDCHEEIQT